MKRLEIRKIGMGSFFKLHFVIGMGIGLIVCGVMTFIRPALNALGMENGIIDSGRNGFWGVSAAIIGVVAGSLAYGVILGVTGVGSALLYNICSRLVGGIVIKVEEERD